MIKYKSKKYRSVVCTLLFLFLAMGAAADLQAQDYDLLLKGGHVIDPKNDIDSPMDVAIKDGIIARVAAGISERDAEQVVDVSGLYVTPGLIDLHSHNYYGTEPNRSYSNGFNAIPPDGFTFRSGVTTVVDVGGAGWRNFRHFKEQVIDRSQTRVLAFVNIVGEGMSGIHESNINDMDPRMTARAASRHSEIVGVKIAHFTGPEWRTTIQRAVEAGTLADVPVMVDFGGGRPSIEELFMELLRPGDIFTHVYHPGPHKEPVVDEDGRVKPFVFEAEKKGIVFDVGHGGGSFLFAHAIPSVEQGLLPTTISTDIHVGSMNAGMKDMANVMSKFINMGMSLQDVVLRSTWNPAMAIKTPELGHLSEGAEADIAVFRLQDGDFGFVDSREFKMQGSQKLETELTVRAGRIVWDLNGLSSPVWNSRTGLTRTGR
ncbi:MAG: amidohydrolase/deacetylase family metallohydrolase [Balneolaceae bacterium]